jgi:hypothetical protein
MLKLLALMSAAAAIAACGPGSTPAGRHAVLPALGDVPPQRWRELSRQRIFFGHQSVGENILSGVAQIMAQDPRVGLRVVRTDDPARFEQPLLAHASIGSNGDPASKIRAFDAALRSGIGKKADIALFKFCFWDIRAGTDVATLFRSYRETLAALRRDFPETVFVHATVPLMARRTGLAQQLKRLVGRPDAWDLDNAKRAELNELLLHEYGGKEPLFDIALAESTLPDGRRSEVALGGRAVPSLAERYSRDGGHLTAEGERWVGAQFLVALARSRAGGGS